MSRIQSYVKECNNEFIFLHQNINFLTKSLYIKGLFIRNLFIRFIKTSFMVIINVFVFISFSLKMYLQFSKNFVRIVTFIHFNNVILVVDKCNESLAQAFIVTKFGIYFLNFYFSWLKTVLLSNSFSVLLMA